MNLALKKMNVAEYPLTVCLLCLVGIVMIAKNFMNLLHQFKLRIWTKFLFTLFIFHVSYCIS